MTTPNSKGALKVWKKQKGDYGKKSKLGRSAVNEIQIIVVFDASDVIVNHK